jgi:hypothetical protein
MSAFAAKRKVRVIKVDDLGEKEPDSSEENVSEPTTSKY